MLHSHQKFKTFFDKLILDDPTSHTVLLLYFLLDCQLYKVILGIDEETTNGMVKDIVIDFTMC